MKKFRYVGRLAVLGAVWLGLTAFCWAKPADNVSESERRPLAEFPELSAQTVLSGDFMSDFEKYSLDQFPLRDSFRTLKSFNTFYVFSQKENNGIYIEDGYAAKLEYPLNEQSVLSAVDKFRRIYDLYLAETDAKVYISVVPDKGCFLARQNGYPSLDYEELFSLVRDNADFAEYIHIADRLEFGDYYRTDTHWRQEKISDVAHYLAEAMGAGSLDGDYTVMTADVPFYGVYYGQSALPLGSERIKYLVNPTLEACTVYNAETGKTGGIYDFDKLAGRDPYEFFLSGSAPLLVIDNPLAATDRELVIFRDSFGSSLAPLLTEAYSKVTLIDTRYISTDLVGDYVKFDNQDILFIYSTLILNSSTVLK